MTKLNVLVVGGGVMGMSTGCAIAAHGANVTVLERFTLAHDWASSHGLSRAIRHEYGPLEIYTHMVARSLVLWDELARETGRHLYTETGVLTLGQPDDNHTLPGYEVMRAIGLPVERLTSEECQQRFPQFRPGGYEAITYNPVGGMLHATECLLALADRLQARGGVLREGVRVAQVEPTANGARVRLADGSALMADRVIVTAGPWVHDVLPELSLPVRATRQQISYFGGLSPEDFAIGRFPVFLAGMHYYGFPMHGQGWFKAASHQFGATVDPNTPYAPDKAELESVRAFLHEVIPSAANAPLAAFDHCMYDLTPDEDFILDRYPGADTVVIGSGFSGHGFKFGVLIGELLATLALGEPAQFPLERFRLDRFSHGHHPAAGEHAG